MFAFGSVFVQCIINGIAIGCIYGLIALGFVLIYKATEVVNFAQGEMMMIGAFIAYTLIGLLGLNYWLAFVFTLILMGLFGVLLDRIVLRPLVGEKTFTIVMVTIGFGILARSVVSTVPVWGTENFTFRSPFANKALRVADLVLSGEAMAVIILTVVLVLLFYVFFKHTEVGVSLRATAQNQLAAVYMGVDIKGVFSLTWGISASVAGAAGVFLASITMVHVNMGFIGLKAFPAAVLGGFGSIPGAIVGGAIIGVTESLAAVYLPIGWKDIVAYIILILVLMIRPEGLFGIQEKKKV